MFLSSDDPAISLNYAIFLYNMGDKKHAAKQFSIYEKKMEVFRQTKTSDLDREVGYFVFFVFFFYLFACLFIIICCLSVLMFVCTFTLSFFAAFTVKFFISKLFSFLFLFCFYFVELSTLFAYFHSLLCLCTNLICLFFPGPRDS